VARALSAEDVEDFQDRLCDAAERIFADYGLEAITMRALAAEMGVSAMTPYRYFKDKDAIIAAVRARAFNRHADALEAAYATAGTLEERADAVGEAYLRFALENPEAYKLMFDIKQAGAFDYPELVAAGSRSQRTMTRHVEAMIEAGHVTGDPLLIGHMFWSALHGAVLLQLAGMLAPPLDARKIASEVTETLWRGLQRP
jgi:AcrR family transcriptional regulator